MNANGFGAGEFEAVLSNPLIYGTDACLESSLNIRHPFTTSRYGKKTSAKRDDSVRLLRHCLMAFSLTKKSTIED